MKEKYLGILEEAHNVQLDISRVSAELTALTRETSS